jgi:hypothetical protein
MSKTSITFLCGVTTIGGHLHVKETNWYRPGYALATPEDMSEECNHGGGGYCQHRHALLMQKGILTPSWLARYRLQHPALNEVTELKSQLRNLERAASGDQAVQIMKAKIEYRVAECYRVVLEAAINLQDAAAAPLLQDAAREIEIADAYSQGYRELNADIRQRFDLPARRTLARR